MTRPLLMYQVVCDCCGRPATTSDYCAWTDDLGAQETASESGWLMDHEGKDYCWECHSYGDNDELVINESRRGTFKAKARDILYQLVKHSKKPIPQNYSGKIILYFGSADPETRILHEGLFWNKLFNSFQPFNTDVFSDIEYLEEI